MQKTKNKPTELGKVIKKQLIDKNMTQRELADRAGMSYKYLHLIIYGHKSGENTFLPFLKYWRYLMFIDFMKGAML